MATLPARGIGFADDSNGLRPGLQHCLEAALNQSDGLIDGVITGLDITVTKAHGGTTGSAPKPVMKQTIERMVANRVQMRATFADQLRLVMYGGLRPEAQAQPLLRFDDLQLLTEDKLDENIEAAWALQEIVLAVEDVLPELDGLVSTLLGWITVQPQLNPLRPEVFVRAMRAAMIEQIPDNEIRGALMTPAAGRLGAGLRKLYRELSDWLGSQGIEPAGLQGITSKSLSNVARGNNAASGVGASVARTILTLDRLRKLLSGELDEAPPNSQGLEFLYTVPASLDALQDMKMVEAMMQRLAKRNKERSSPRFVIRRSLDSAQIGQQLGEEVIRLLLDNLLHDERMLLQVRSLLEAMEPALMRLARNEPRFFSEKQHPARHMLDRLTHRSLAFTSERDPGYGRFMLTAEQAVSDLLDMDNVTSASFSQVLKTLEEAWAQDDQVLKLQREQAARALLHAEQRNLLAQRLSQEFRAQIAAGDNRDVPTFVLEFICGAWAQVVAESQLSSTDDSSHQYVAVVDELVWSVQPRIARRKRNRLLELVPDLLGRLRRGLGLVSYPPEMTAKFFDNLIVLHEAALEGPRPKPTAEQEPDFEPEFEPTGRDELELSQALMDAAHEMGEPDFADSQAEASLPTNFNAPEPLDKSNAAAPADAGELSSGSWVELQVDEQWVRAQLTWVSPHHTLFMFTSMGNKAHSMSRRTIARLRAQGQMRIVSEGGVMSSALDAVAHAALRNTVEQTGAPR